MEWKTMDIVLGIDFRSPLTLLLAKDKSDIATVDGWTSSNPPQIVPILSRTEGIPMWNEIPFTVNHLGIWETFTHRFGQPIKVNWAYASGEREDTSGHYSIFVGDLSPEVTDATLFACFSVYPSCS
ncbi:hypothetical protein HHK36_032808 [Tetracentron sinense]|uniref:Uncharacterized protein n=1 Tax=Tetracentron sinense TaxID=13715 RepID=A0A834Y9U9_TETSI|nr:hypothetical protein HHK36_033121 [Tetracentron sinense]KAF8365187.1 hypothetical protein HHK36_032808 [Tetracentron sinense]